MDGLSLSSMRVKLAIMKGLVLASHKVLSEDVG